MRHGTWDLAQPEPPGDYSGVAHDGAVSGTGGGEAASRKIKP